MRHLLAVRFKARSARLAKALATAPVMVPTTALVTALATVPAMVLVAALALPVVAHAARPWKVLEDSYELSASSVRLPDQSSGALSVVDCDGCRTGRFGLADDAVFSVAGKAVSYTELLAAFRGGRYRSVYFDLRRESGEVSRVRIFP